MEKNGERWKKMEKDGERLRKIQKDEKRLRKKILKSKKKKGKPIFFLIQIIFYLFVLNKDYSIIRFFDQSKLSGFMIL